MTLGRELGTEDVFQEIPNLENRKGDSRSCDFDENAPFYPSLCASRMIS